MAVLWERGSGTVAEIRERLSDELAYTTVLTVLQTLEAKGYVRHASEGRAYRYYPLVERAAAEGSAVRRLTDRLFAGSTALLLTHLVSERHLSHEELKRLKDLLDARLKERRR
jgi:predicted transcriptional regulator